METKYLRYFLQVCEDRNLSKAARKLYLSQQAVSVIIRKLEDEFQVALFERTSSGMELTEYGHCLYEWASQVVHLMDETYNSMETLRVSRQNILHIGISFGVMSALPPAFINNFQQKYPQIELRFTEYPDVQCEQAVLNDHEALGLSIMPVDHSQFNVYTIIRDYMCLLAHKDSAFYNRKSIEFKELSKETFLLLTQDFKVRQTFEKQCKLAGFTPHVLLETMELILIHNFSNLNRGMGIGVEFIAQDLPNIRPIRFKPDCPWEVCVISRKDKAHSEAAQRFIRYVKQLGCYYPGTDFA